MAFPDIQAQDGATSLARFMSERLGALLSGLLFAFALHVGAQDFGPPAASGLLASALLALVLLSVTGGGRIALRAFAVRDLSESEKTLIGATLGLGLLSQGVFLLGALGWLKTWTACVLMGALWVAGFTEMRDMLRSLGANANLLRERPLATGGVLAGLGLLFWFTWVPPHQYDSLVYHLALPAAYVRAGRVSAVQHLLFSYFPQNGEMLYTLALLLGSDALAQMLTWLCAFLSVWWLFEMGKREVPATVGLLACLLVVTHTAVMLLAPTTYVECVVMLWITAAVLSFLRWNQRSDMEGYSRAWLALSGIFAGLGVGTKYYAAITPALLAAYLAARWIKTRSTQARKDLLLFAATSAIAGAPWLLKNALTVGNPVFPFFYRLLPPRGVNWGAAGAARYFEFLTEYGHHKGQFFKELISFPYMAAIGSARFGGGADVLGDLGWGLTFAALPLSAWAAWKNRYLRWMLAYCLFHWAVWYFTGVVLRFLVVLVPLLSLLTAHGLYQLWKHTRTSGRVLLASAVAVFIAVNLGLFLYVHSLVGSLSVLVGLQTRQQYLARMLDYYPCAAYARENLPQNDKILVVGEQRGYYIAQPNVTTTPMAPNPFVLMADAASDVSDLARRLKEQGGFRYLLVVPQESKRLEGYGIFHFTEGGLARWSALENGYIGRVYDSPGRCALYKIN